MAGKQDKLSNTCPESCSLYSHSIAKVLLYVFVRGAKILRTLGKVGPMLSGETQI